MSDDLARRLRDFHLRGFVPFSTIAMMKEAADRIEALEAELQTLRDRIRRYQLDEGITS